MFWFASHLIVLLYIYSYKLRVRNCKPGKIELCFDACKKEFYNEFCKNVVLICVWRSIAKQTLGLMLLHTHTYMLCPCDSVCSWPFLWAQIMYWLVAWRIDYLIKHRWVSHQYNLNMRIWMQDNLTTFYLIKSTFRRN